jgi:hypothetical protein
MTSRCAARRAAVLVGLTVLGTVLAACSSPPKAATTSTMSTTSTPSGGSVSGEIHALSSSLQNSETATFKAVYTVTTAGTTQTVTIEQAPPKSLFSVKDGSVIDTGTATYYCSTSGTVTCLSSGSSEPLASLAALFSPKTALNQLQVDQSEAAFKGYSITFSSGSYGGQSTTCANVSGHGASGKYCVTKQGVLAYVSSNGSRFSLTSYSSSVPASAFTLPAGATVQTLPPGVTIPG